MQTKPHQYETAPTKYQPDNSDLRFKGEERREIIVTALQVAGLVSLFTAIVIFGMAWIRYDILRAIQQPPTQQEMLAYPEAEEDKWMPAFDYEPLGETT